MMSRRFLHGMWDVFWWVTGISTVSLFSASFAQAQSVASSVHWGAMGYPDRDRALMAGMTFNRFSEFDGEGRKFNGVNESAGFNLVTVSWTERILSHPGWTSNFTVGAGPTQPDPTLYLQNDFTHRLLGNHSVPVGQRRRETDFVVNGSMTRWGKLFGEREVGFASIGFASGSLYHEVFGRIGIRRASLAEMLQPVMGGSEILRKFSRFVRVSGMGHYGKVFGGAAFRDSVLAEQSFLGQGSISFADYGENDVDPPRWELEFAVTIDSGLFANFEGHRIERRFGSLALRFPYGVVESWNDVLGGTDSGPTYGFQVMFDVRRMYALLTAP